MNMETIKKEIKGHLIDTVFSMLFLLCLVILKFTHKIEENTFILGLLLWAIITPSPHRWVISLGNWIKARKNGGIEITAAKNGNANGGENTADTNKENQS